MQAGILEKPDGDTDLSRHIFADQHLTEEQRQAMMRIYLSFRHENEDEAEGHQADGRQVVRPDGPERCRADAGRGRRQRAGSGGSTAAVG